MGRRDDIQEVFPKFSALQAFDHNNQACGSRRMVPPGSNNPVEATIHQSEGPLEALEGVAEKKGVNCCVVLSLLVLVAWWLLVILLLILLLLLFRW